MNRIEHEALHLSWGIPVSESTLNQMHILWGMLLCLIIGYLSKASSVVMIVPLCSWIGDTQCCTVIGMLLSIELSRNQTLCYMNGNWAKNKESWPRDQAFLSSSLISLYGVLVCMLNRQGELWKLWRVWWGYRHWWEGIRWEGKLLWLCAACRLLSEYKLGCELVVFACLRRDWPFSTESMSAVY